MSDSWLKLSTADKVWLLTHELDTIKALLEKLLDTCDTEQFRVSKELEAHSEELSQNLLRLCLDFQED